MANRDLKPGASDVDSEALMADLYKENFRLLYLFIRARVESDEVAEDICAEAFAKAWKNLAKFEGGSSMKTWLFAIARNLLVDFYRRKSRWSFLPWSAAQNAALEETTRDEGRGDEAELTLKGLLAKLPESQATVLSLRFLANLSVKETAESMQITEANVKVLQHRALKKAKQLGGEQL